jgi:hypothetical protein
MAEILTLASSIDPPKTVFRIAQILFDWVGARIEIHVREYAGGVFGERVIVAFYTGPTATTLMNQLNTLNLSTAGNSLHQRIITRLLADSKLPTGIASGAPD